MADRPRQLLVPTSRKEGLGGQRPGHTPAVCTATQVPSSKQGANASQPLSQAWLSAGLAKTDRWPSLLYLCVFTFPTFQVNKTL